MSVTNSRIKHIDGLRGITILAVVFLLLGIGIYVSLLILYTFPTLFLTGIIYFLLIPISFFHYRNKNKKILVQPTEEEDEEIL